MAPMTPRRRGRTPYRQGHIPATLIRVTSGARVRALRDPGAVHSATYRRALRSTLAGTALPYGSTARVFGARQTVMHMHGTSRIHLVLLFAVGAVARLPTSARGFVVSALGRPCRSGSPDVLGELALELRPPVRAGVAGFRRITWHDVERKAAVAATLVVALVALVAGSRRCGHRDRHESEDARSEPRHDDPRLLVLRPIAREAYERDGEHGGGGPERGSRDAGPGCQDDDEGAEDGRGDDKCRTHHAVSSPGVHRRPRARRSANRWRARP